MTREEPQRRAIRLLWVDVEAKEIIFANQLLVQHVGSEFVITFGQATPPPIVGTPEEQAEMLERVEFVPVKTVARLGLTAQRMTEFVQVLQQNLSAYEQQKGIE